MKKDIHPKLYMDTKVTCACGNTFVTMSTLPEISVEICSNCHPFFTGTQKFIDTEGQISKFRKKVETAKTTPKKAKKVKVKAGADDDGKQKTLKEMLAQARTNEE